MRYWRRRWGENHIRTLFHLGNLAGIVEANSQRLDELVEQYPVAGFTQIDAAIQQKFDGYVLLVTKDIPDYALAAGVPAKQTGWVCECGMTLKSELKCTACGKKYRLGKGTLWEREC